MNSKRKGNAGERELLDILRRNGIESWRNDQKYVGGRDNPDIGCRVEGIPVHIECKRCEKLSLYAAMDQAIRDSAGNSMPIVVHRRNGKPWLVIARLDDVLKTKSQIKPR